MRHLWKKLKSEKSLIIISAFAGVAIVFGLMAFVTTVA